MNGLAFSPAEVETVARQCFGEPNWRLSRPFKLRFGRRGSRIVDLACGVFFDHEAGVGGGLLDMLVHAGHARTRGEAARLLPNLGELLPRRPFPGRRERVGQEEAARVRRRASAAALWAQATPLADTVAARYLREARAITAPLDRADLRFQPAAPVLPYRADCRERRPAMIAKLSDAGGLLLGAHVTFLQPDGRGKADMASPRKVAGTRRGGFVWLAPSARLIVAEGLESALAAWQARPAEARDFGAVAAICAGGMADLIWPTETTAMIIAPDRDNAGERAAEMLARRAWADGLAVSLMWPPDGFADWNDWARAERGRL